MESNRYTVAAIVAIIAIATGSCGGGETTALGGPRQSPPADTGTAARPEPIGFASSPEAVNAAALLAFFSSASPYGAWPYWPGHEGVQPGKAPHGAFHRIFITKGFADALASKPGVAPEGAVVLKETYDSEKNLVHLDVMAKVPGYNPEAGDWFWAEYDGSGKVLVEGRVGMCISCHASFKANDYLIVGKLGN